MNRRPYWLILWQRHGAEFPIIQSAWDLELAKRCVRDQLNNPRTLRWLTLTEYRPNHPPTVILDWKP